VADPHDHRSLPKALQAPVRAMSRMLGNGNGDHAPASPDLTEHSAVVDCGLYLDGVRQPGRPSYDEALRIARSHPCGNGFVWLGLREPTEHELTGIAEVFGLHELAVEDAVKSAQRPKVERYGDMTFMAMRTARYVTHQELNEFSEVVETGAVMLFLGPHYIITVRHGEACDLSSVRAQLDEHGDLIEQGPWSVAYAVYDLVVDGYLDVANRLEDDIELVEEQVFARHVDGKIQWIYQVKRELMEFRRAALPLQRPLNGLVAGQLADVPAEMHRYFRDVSDHLTRVAEQVVHFDDLLTSILQARLAQVTVDQNNDMRKIAAWAGIAAVWTSIAGVYGMNFRFMPELHWRFGYPVVVTIILGVSIALYRAFRRSGWL
jgi:magnesium transporter